MLWENLRSEQFEEAVARSMGVCVVPIGCLEKHGPHSPLGTDTIIAAGIATKAAEIEPVVIFPTMFFGDKSGAGEFPGTVVFSLETRWHIFRETCNEIHRNGFKKILFLNAHGGNKDMLGAFTRAMMEENPDVMCFVTGVGGDALPTLEGVLAATEGYEYLTPEDRAAMQDMIDRKLRCGHACFSETARAYYFRPETVRLDGIAEESGSSTHRMDVFKEHGISTHFTWMGNYPNSYQGDNNYTLNERIARAYTEYRIPIMAERFRFLKNETVSDEYFKEWRPKQK